MFFKDDEVCEIAEPPNDEIVNEIIEEIKGYKESNITFVRPSDERTLCSFPFRYKNILYYACTNITRNGTFSGLGSTESPIHLCATEKDLDYHPTKMGFCNTNFRCPIQCKNQLKINYIIKL